MGYSLEVNDLCVEIEHRDVFSNISFKVPHGALCQLSGPNGSGKSTMLLVLAGLFEAAQGQVLWSDAGQFVSIEQVAEQFVFISTRLGLTPELSVSEHLQWLAALHGVDISQSLHHSIMDRLGLSGRSLKRLVSTLSSGQLQRLKLAQLFINKRPIWLLDEPFTALDAQAVVWLEHILMDHVKDGGIALYASHHRSKLLQPDVVVCLEHDEQLQAGRLPKESLTKE